MNDPNPELDHDANGPTSDSHREEIGTVRSGILHFAAIQKSPKLTKLLDFLLRHAEKRDGSRVDQYRLAFDCLGMDASFDASQSALIRVHLSKLRKALLDYADGPGKAEPLRILLPKGSYSLEIRKASDSPTPERRPVLALLEFKGIGMEGEWRMLPALLSEQLTDRVSRSAGFDFMGPFSRQIIGTEDPDLCGIAARLGIDCFVDGYIHGRNNEFELGIRIVEGSTGRVTWTATEVLPLNRPSLAAIENELLRRLASMIGADYGGVDAHFSRLARVKCPQALSVYEAVLLGRMYFSDFNPRALPVAIARLREVVRQFPREPLPKATLAMLLANAGHEPRWPDLPPAGEIRSLAADAWRDAPEEPWSILACGFAACFGVDGHHEIQRLARALDADPDAAAMTKCGIGVLLCLRCIHTDQGLRLIRESRRINPYQPCAVHVVEALIALRNGELNAAIQHLDIYRLPWGWADPLIRGAVYASRGERDLAVGEYRAALAAFPNLETAAFEEGRLIWHREHMSFLIGAFAKIGITAAARQ